MTVAGIGTGAKARNFHPPPKVSDTPTDTPPLPESQSRGSLSPLRVVRDPRKKANNEGDEGHDPVSEDSSMELAESMTELAFLGSLLGMPSIFDPMFPATYATFFGSYPSWMNVGTQGSEPKVMEKNSEDSGDVFVSPMISNLVNIPTFKAEDQAEPKECKTKEVKTHVTPTPQKLKRIRVFDLSNSLREIKEVQIKTITSQTFQRILTAEKVSLLRGTSEKRISVIINLVCQFGGSYASALLDFIVDDFRANFDLAIAWLFAEYALTENYCLSRREAWSYETCLTLLLNGACERLESRDRLFTRLILEAPKITPSVMDNIKSYCCTEEKAFLGINTLKELILKRPHGPHGTEDFLQMLLEITLGSVELARVQALHVTKKLYAKSELSAKIERFALQSLQYLLSDFPPFQDDTGDMEIATEWTEESVNLCLQLFVSLLPLNHKLLKDLAMIYTSTTPSVKRIVLKHIDKPVRTIGMESPELLHLVENCPVGAETLIMRILYILTENCPPSGGLVERVRELYKHNPSDVRFLIPVLHGLHKNEVLAALPYFIKLSPNLVRGVFDRLLLSFRGDHGHSISPVTPSELLVALHNIDCSNDEALMKSAIKATNICFSEKSIYTQEVLAVVLQQLLDHTPIPVLFMRTVIQSLAAHPKLVSFVMTILNRLISRQVWKMPTVWQGFLRCCELTKPHSLTILLQLPQKQLIGIVQVDPGLQKELVEHIELYPHTKMTLPSAILQSLGLHPTGESDIKKKRKDSSTKKRRHSSKSNSQDKESFN
ncbi:Symplekin [Geodia barretti]|nr:Symplekin [Geodia barretti]